MQAAAVVVCVFILVNLVKNNAIHDSGNLMIINQNNKYFLFICHEQHELIHNISVNCKLNAF